MIGWALGSVAAKYVTVWDPHGLRELAVRGRQDLRGRRQGRRARDRDHRRKLFRPNGIEFHKASLYVATPKHIKRYDNIEANLDKPPAPVMVFDKLTGEVPHGWNYIRVGPDNKLYVPVGAPRNICAHNDAHMKIMRMNLDGSGVENVATDVRNTVGFDFDPKNGDLWCTNNGPRLALRRHPERHAQPRGGRRQRGLGLPVLPPGQHGRREFG